jgi:hypothetical protein
LDPVRHHRAGNHARESAPGASRRVELPPALQQGEQDVLPQVVTIRAMQMQAPRALRGLSGGGEQCHTQPAGRPWGGFGNKDVALRLGARYRAGGWYAPSGVDLAEFQQRGWLCE